MRGRRRYKETGKVREKRRKIREQGWKMTRREVK